MEYKSKETTLKHESDPIQLAVENDFKKLDDLIEECFNFMTVNKIYIIDNKKLFETEYIGQDTSTRAFDNLMELLRDEEDIRNCGISIREKKYKDTDIKGFNIFYPHLNRNDLCSIKVEIIESVSEYIEKVLYDEKELDDKKVFYRGHGNWRYDFLPAIYRPKNSHILLHESEYIKDVISSYPQYFTECKSALDYLSVLQHNGFPTRLLDFSENPLVALYMACENETNNHADSMRVTVPKKYFEYYDSDIVSILSNIAFIDDNFSIKDFSIRIDEYKDENIEKFNRRNDIKKLVHLIHNEKPTFEPFINPKHLDGYILFVKPRRNFDRISHQSGLFALYGICRSKSDMPQIEFLNPPCDITHYIIPAYLKRKILEELSRLNITEANVYCDMEHVAKHYIKKSQNNEINSIIDKKECKEQIEIKSILDDKPNWQDFDL